MHYVDGCENDTVQVSCTALSLARTSVLQGGGYCSAGKMLRNA